MQIRALLTSPTSIYRIGRARRVARDLYRDRLQPCRNGRECNVDRAARSSIHDGAVIGLREACAAAASDLDSAHCQCGAACIRHSDRYWRRSRPDSVRQERDRDRRQADRRRNDPGTSQLDSSHVAARVVGDY